MPSHDARDGVPPAPRSPRRPLATAARRAAVLGALTCAFSLPEEGARAAEGTAIPPDAEARPAIALAEEWFRATEDRARRDVEARVAALPPLSAAAVPVLSKRILALHAAGPKLDGNRGTLYPGKGGGRGAYALRRGKRGGGLLIALAGAVDWAGDVSTADATWGSAGTDAGFSVVSTQPLDWEASDWKRAAEGKFLVDLLDAALRTTGADRNRVVVAGYGMGAEGAWLLAGHHPDRFAGLAAVAGRIPHMMRGDAGAGRTRAEYEGVRQGILPNLLHVRTWIYHSEDDATDPIHPADLAAEGLRTLSGRFTGRFEHRYERVAGRGHALPKAGVVPIVRWLAEARREPYPREVIWETRRGVGDRVHWLRSRGHDDYMRFHARVEAPNHVEIAACARQMFEGPLPSRLPVTILLSPRMFDFDRPIRVTCRGKVLHEGPVTRSAWAVLVTLAPRGDPDDAYEGSIDVEVPRTPWTDLPEPLPVAADR